MDSKANHFLQEYLHSLSSEDRSRYLSFDSYYFCSNEKDADECAALTLKGEKRATAASLWCYEYDKEPIPKIGHLTVITNWKKTPQCIIEVTSVEIKPFNEVDASFAFEEGEGDKSLAYWKKVHWQFFSEECKEIGKEPSEDMPVVLIQFKVV